jgi:hypothetical protein
LAEKLFLQLIAIKFHQKALADRLAENRSGLKALDRLSNAHPAAHKKISQGRRGHKGTGGSLGTFIDISASLTHSIPRNSTRDGQNSANEDVDHNPEKPTTNIRSGHVERQRRRRRAVASIIVDQLGGAIHQVALKDSRFNRQGEIGGLSSARRLARKLFSALTDVSPPRSHLIVEGAFFPFSIPL